MKNCPFCFAQIPDEALKCSHCGEWVTNKPNAILNTINQTFNQSKDFVKEKIEEYKENKYKHLYIPDNNHPLEVEDYQFFGSYALADGVKYPFSEIVSMSFSQGVFSYNLISEKSISLILLFSLGEQSFPIENRYDKRRIALGNSYTFSTKSKKEADKIRLLYSLLREATFEQRLKQYRDMIEKYGFFHYPEGFKIYKNWDIVKDDKIVANLRDACDKELVEYGTSRKGLRSSSSDPNCLMIHKSKGLKVNIIGGIPLYRQTSINITFDKDVFDHFFALLRY